MPPDEHESEMPLLDEWQEAIGDEAVGAAVESARRGIAQGSIPGFSSQKELVDYLRKSRRESA